MGRRSKGTKKPAGQKLAGMKKPPGGGLSRILQIKQSPEDLRQRGTYITQAIATNLGIYIQKAVFLGQEILFLFVQHGIV